MEQWNPCTNAYIKLDHLACITEYNKHIGGEDSLDAMVSVYRINVCGKKWYWPHYVIIINVLESKVFKMFKLFNLNVKMDFLGFTRLIVMHYLKLNKLKQQNPPSII